MKTITVTEAKNNIFKLIDLANKEGIPIQITGKRGNAILISEEDWNAINETRYLLSVPGMRESIKKGLKEPIDKCSDKITW